MNHTTWTHRALPLALLFTLLLVASGATAEDGTSTKGDPSVTPWNDPDDPYVIRLNRDDPSTTSWNARNERLAKDRKGPTDLNRYGGGARHEAFPTFLGAPVALTPQELKDGDIDVAIVGALTTGAGGNFVTYFVATGTNRRANQIPLSEIKTIGFLWLNRTIGGAVTTIFILDD